MPSPDARIDALEMRIAHQDETIEELNAAVTAQWAAIDRLTRELRALAERTPDAGPDSRLVAADEPPPPHY